MLLLAFDRPALLAKVAESLAAQQPTLDPARVHLFLDGAYCPHRDALVADPAQVDRTALAFRRIFPAGQVHRAPHNLGVAFNYDRAERFAFETLGAEVGYFFEDDLVLSPHYLATLDRLAALALQDERIAYVAAYGDHTLDVAAQQAAQRQLRPLEHHWGFALTRRHWLERQPILAPYLDLLRGHNYRDRRDAEVMEYFWRLGVGLPGTSQDGAKGAAAQLLGRLRLSSVPVLGRYIGEVGLHFTPQVFRDAGFHLTQPYPAEAPLDGFDLPDEATMQAMLAASLAAGRELCGIPQSEQRTWPAMPLPLDHEGLVTLMYRTMLDRDPDAGGLADHSTALRDGLTTPERLVLAFLRSAEFMAVYGPALASRLEKT